MLSWELFERQFAADPRIVGSAVFFEGRPVTVTGVLPKDFRFQFPMWWISTRPQPVEVYAPLTPDDIRRSRFVNVVAGAQAGRGSRAGTGRAEVLEKSIIDRRQAGQPRALRESCVLIRSRKSSPAAPSGVACMLVAGVFLLLIACVNMTNLLLVRASPGGMRSPSVLPSAPVGDASSDRCSWKPAPVSGWRCRGSSSRAMGDHRPNANLGVRRSAPGRSVD